MEGTGETTSTQFTELEAKVLLPEAMNQMIGTASTSVMATMINRKVDILPPIVKLWSESEALEYEAVKEERNLLYFILTKCGRCDRE